MYSWESGERVKVRFVYYGVKTKYKGTIFADLRDGTIPNKTHFYKDSSIDDIVKMFETNATVAMVIFWIAWLILTGGIVYGFPDVAQAWADSKKTIEEFQKSLIQKSVPQTESKREMSDLSDQTGNSPILDGMKTGDDDVHES